jgi:hypothetical protein
MLATVVFILCVMVDLIWMLHARLSPTVSVSSTLKRSSSFFPFGECRIKSDTFPVPLQTSRSEMEQKWTLKLLQQLPNRKHCINLCLILNWRIYVSILSLPLCLSSFSLCYFLSHTYTQWTREYKYWSFLQDVRKQIIFLLESKTAHDINTVFILIFTYILILVRPGNKIWRISKSLKLILSLNTIIILNGFQIFEYSISVNLAFSTYIL